MARASKAARQAARQLQAKVPSRLDRAQQAVSQLKRQIDPDAKIPPLMRLQLERAVRDLDRLVLLDRWGHKKGTPETYEKIEAVPPGMRQSPIARLWEAGQITLEEFTAAEEIEMVAEAITRGVSVKSASLDMRIQNGSAGRDALLESLARIRLDVAYSTWRERLPMPRAMVLDMILTTQPLVRTAAAYRVPWRRARKYLIDALDRWIDLKEVAWRTIDEADVLEVYSRIGCGMLLPPKPKKGLELGDSD